MAQCVKEGACMRSSLQLQPALLKFKFWYQGFIPSACALAIPALSKMSIKQISSSRIIFGSPPLERPGVGSYHPPGRPSSSSIEAGAGQGPTGEEGLKWRMAKAQPLLERG